ncbi:OLC1v1017889C2 [Oldenlandia corymbosa var. corymbosa]|nr:OLC1v1017889C2 [Oldenlandia corymbosa var. corymbosa]
MLEYKITEVGPHGTKIGKDSRAICRVYHSAEAERLNGNLALSLASVVPQRDTTYTKGSPSVLLAHNGGDTEQLTAGDYSHLDLQMTSDLNQMFEDDYVALDDLDALISNSTTSGNPSCLTMFLLNDENDDKQLNSGSDERLDPQRRDASGLYYIKDDDYIELDDLATLMSNGNGAQKFNYGADKRLDPQRIGKHIMEDDYLELDDLDDPLSLSTTSDNSSRSSFNLDEYFDPGAMMQALNRNINSSIGSTVSPFEVIMPPATAGSQVGAGENQPVAECTSSTLKTKNAEERDEDHTVKKLRAEQNNGDPSCSKDIASTSKNGRLIISRGKKKASGVKMKGLKKYFCLMPF